MHVAWGSILHYRKQARAQGWGDQYCDLNYLSFSTLSTIDRLRGQVQMQCRHTFTSVYPNVSEAVADAFAACRLSFTANVEHPLAYCSTSSCCRMKGSR